MAAQDEKQKSVQDDKSKDETFQVKELVDRVKAIREMNPEAKGYILCFKKGDLVGQASHVVRDYVQRHFGPCLILELSNPDKDFKCLEVTK